MKTDLIIFPSSYFSANEIDEELTAEYNSAIDTGLFDTVLFSYDKWFNNGKLLLNKDFTEMHYAVYRGWMMKPEQYESFYNELLQRNIQLITKPEQYKLFHIFPNIYPCLEADTAKMLVFNDKNEIDINEIKKHFKRFMIKDFVKSVKGTDFPKYFDAAVTNEDFDQWMKVFYKYRGSLNTGGICAKEYLDLRKYEGRTNEYRVFYINNEIAAVSRNSGQGDYAPQPPVNLLEKYRNLDSPYYTIDYAELEDGGWVIIEAGDGQVSGLSDGQNYSAYFRALYMCLNQ